MAAVGAVSSTAREGQQLSSLFVVPVIIPVYLMPIIMEHPQSVLSRVLVFIPITAPVTVMVRIGLSGISAWEVAVSIALSVLTIYACFILAARLFRAYLLMYGKRPGLGEIVRALRQA